MADGQDRGTRFTVKVKLGDFTVDALRISSAGPITIIRTPTRTAPTTLPA
jgi:hypothetical protein